MLTKITRRRLAALLTLLLPLSASVLAAQATAPQVAATGGLSRAQRSIASPQAVGDFKIFLPLTQKIIPPLRIDSAASAGHTDAAGNVWVADTGFVGGIAGNFGNISIANTNDPLIYQTERYQLTGYSIPVANGTYTVTLHFAENFQTAAGKRIFSVNVEGTSILIDVFAAAGGSHIALLQSVSVTVSDSQLNIDFTKSVGDAMINGVEIIPQ